MVHGSGRKVELITLQFVGSNESIVPKFARRLPDETWHEMSDRRDRSGTGIRLIEPVEEASPELLLEDLRTARFEMVDAECQRRINKADSKKPFYMVRFMFARRGSVAITRSFKGIRYPLERSLKRLCENSLWRIFAHENPLFVNDREVPEKRSISINLGTRVPLVIDGKPVLRRKKDGQGRPVGAPAHIDTNRFVRMTKDCVLRVIDLTPEENPVVVEAEAEMA
ncbi:MAG: hypothetical protein HGA31_01435 [Candidatus Moranbacteria bacterium]|nr:hypothetical protein [Candidatus Moranbacteria bacterium]